MRKLSIWSLQNASGRALKLGFPNGQMTETDLWSGGHNNHHYIRIVNIDYLSLMSSFYLFIYLF
jgi:hypothetical protein